MKTKILGIVSVISLLILGVHSSAAAQTPCPLSDNNPCTNDKCVNGKTVHTNNFNPCNDNNICTKNDICKNGKCVGATTNNGVSCNDNNACTQGDLCSNGGCVGKAKAVKGPDRCTEASCNTATGAVSYKPKPTEDGNLCTNGFCNPADGVVSQVAKVCPERSQCDSKSGACVKRTPTSSPAQSTGTAASGSKKQAGESAKPENKSGAQSEPKKQSGSGSAGLIGTEFANQKISGKTVLNQGKINLVDLSLEQLGKLMIPHGAQPELEQEFLKDEKPLLCKDCLLDTEKSITGKGSAKAQEDWSHFGLPGMGVVSSVDCYVTPLPAAKTKKGQNPLQDFSSPFGGSASSGKNDTKPKSSSLASSFTCLAATEGSGIYKTSDLIKWEKLEDFPDNAVKMALIDDANPQHYVAASFEALLGRIKKIYHSYNAGKTWGKEQGQVYDPNEDQAGKYDAYDMDLANGQLLLLGHDEKYLNQFTVVKVNDQMGRETLYTVEDTYLGGPEFAKPSLKISPSGSGLLAVEGGAHITKNHGQTWQSLFDLKKEGFEGLDIVGYDVSGDGQIIILALEERLEMNNLDKNENMSTTFASSQNGGSSWDFVSSQDLILHQPDMSPKTEKGTYRIQALTLLDQEQDPGSFLVFSYMNGPALCQDWGTECKQEIKSYGSMTTLKRVNEDPATIFPHDLRIGGMELIQKKDLTGKMENLLIMPTDQGGFVLDLDQQKLWNSTKDLWLGDTGRVQYGNCRLYSGLWHKGGYWVALQDMKAQGGKGAVIPIGTIEGHVNGEHDGYSVKNISSGLCHEAALSHVHGYMPDGRAVDAVKSTALWGMLYDEVKIIRNTHNQKDNHFYSHEDGWWYGFVGYFWTANAGGPPQASSKLIRVKDDMSAWEDVDPDGEGGKSYVIAFGLQREAEKPGTKYNPPALWALTTEFTGFSKYSLWKQTTQGGWELVQADIAKAGAGSWIFDNKGWPFNNKEGMPILIEGNHLMIATNKGIVVSDDQGKSFTAHNNANLAIMTQDKCGRIYVAKKATPTEDGGIYYSEDYGKTLQKLGTKDTKAYVTSLTVDHMNDVLYAGTAGESILKIQLKECEGY